MGQRSLKVIEIGTIRKHGCVFLFAFHSNYGSIFHQFRDKAWYWSQIVILSYPLAFVAPVRGPCMNIAIPFGVEKLRVVGLPDSGKTSMICIGLTIYTEYWRVMDGQTDGQTSCHDTVRAMHTRRAVKTMTVCFIEYRNVTNGQTDRQTDRFAISISRAR